jgi:hypothetical protein
MTPFYACSEAEWMLETIIDDFAMSLDLPDRARFYAVLVELLIARRDHVQQQTVDGVDSKRDPFEHVH